MENENLEILVIEDNPKHMKDVRAEVQRAVDAGLPLSVDYATEGKEAQALMESKTYDGLISDVFFPWIIDIPEKGAQGWKESWERLRSSKTVCGWDKSVSEFCFGVLSRYREESENIRYAMDGWISGKTMHPTGVYFAEEARKRDIPVVLCTDTYHHGYATEPVNHYSSNVGIVLVDLTLRDEKNGSIIRDEATTGTTKDWACALKMLLERFDAHRETVETLWGKGIERRKEETVKQY